jgi:hypothetical protein
VVVRRLEPAGRRVVTEAVVHLGRRGRHLDARGLLRLVATVKLVVLLVLSGALVKVVRVLSGGRVEHGVDGTLARGHTLHQHVEVGLLLLLLLLLLVHVVVGRLAVDVEVLELLLRGLQAHELLLEALLLLGKVQVGADEIGVDGRVHVLRRLLLDADLGRSENLVSRVQLLLLLLQMSLLLLLLEVSLLLLLLLHSLSLGLLLSLLSSLLLSLLLGLLSIAGEGLLLLLLKGKTSGDRRLGAIENRVMADAGKHRVPVPGLGGNSVDSAGGGKGGSRRRLGGSPQAGEEVRPGGGAGSRGRGFNGRLERLE